MPLNPGSQSPPASPSGASCYACCGHSSAATDESPESTWSDSVCTSCRTTAISWRCDASSPLTIASMPALVGRACRGALNSALALRVSIDWAGCKGSWGSDLNISGMEQSMLEVSDCGQRMRVVDGHHGDWALWRPPSWCWGGPRGCLREIFVYLRSCVVWETPASDFLPSTFQQSKC